MIELDELEAFARKNYIPVMLDDTRKFLFDIVSRLKPKRILEIGTAIGYSGIVMLTASPNAVLNTMEMLESSAEMARKNFAEAGVSNRVNLFVGDAKEIVTLLTGSYDFIFMDGPKGQYDVFLPYLTEVLSVGGTLVCDNVLYKGLVENQPDKHHKHVTVARNLKKFIEDIQSDERYVTEILRIGDGVSVSTRVK